MLEAIEGVQFKQFNRLPITTPDVFDLAWWRVVWYRIRPQQILPSD